MSKELTPEEQIKVNAALDVCETSIMFGVDMDIQFVKNILPDHYTVKESNIKGSIHCISDIGIKKGIDSEDDEHWNYIMKAIKKHFGKRFQEVDHNTCFCHVDFTIYLKPRPLKISFDDAVHAADEISAEEYHENRLLIDEEQERIMERSDRGGFENG